MTPCRHSSVKQAWINPYDESSVSIINSSWLLDTQWTYYAKPQIGNTYRGIDWNISPGYAIRKDAP
jgi:hypothetical protein